MFSGVVPGFFVCSSYVRMLAHHKGGDMPFPYIGICDFTSADQVRKMNLVFQEHKHPLSQRKLMVGVMASHETMNDRQSKWTGVYPPLSKLPGIFIPDRGLMNTIHYADYVGIDVLHNLLRLVMACGPNLHALQLDMIWPEPHIIKDFRHKHPDIQVVLQVSSHSLAMVQEDPGKLVEKLVEYSDAIDYVLMDLSMGRSRPMDAEYFRPFLERISIDLPKLGKAVAGRLGPNTLHLLGGLPVLDPSLSVDAQGQLRKSGNPKDPIELDRCEDYLIKTLQILH